MTARQRLDAAYGRRGGSVLLGPPPQLKGPRCVECGQPMLAGQQIRHYVCDQQSPIGKIR